MLDDEDLIARLEANPLDPELGPQRVAMLRYALKLTRAPSSMIQGDVDALREAGFADEDILAVAEVVGYYAFVNRIADGLGVELEP